MNFFKRRDFLAVSALVISGLVGTIKKWPQRKRDLKTAKFLTHEGKLVEVDIRKLPKNKTVATKDKLVSWVWKDQTL
ncbi:MAG: hypothetical protein ABIR06_22735 [Cyclobacteriaceae bacterium]